MRNIIIRIPFGRNGDATFAVNRQEYVERYKRGEIIFAMEYPNEETALRELQSW